MSNTYNGNRVKVTLNSNGTIVIPSSMAIAAICAVNTTANAVTGGIKIGTTNGGTEVLSATAIGGNFIDVIETTLSKRWFSLTNDTTLYIQAVTGWNSASIDFTICLIYID